ncbi:MAG: CRISPR-associated protein Csx19 [Tepidanaerobacteraceae bacterium]|nr:CRISPR-associated protein Csx19 [Tepidanaerobacteraceae bacterium]
MNGLKMIQLKTTSTQHKFKADSWQGLQNSIASYIQEKAYVVAYLDYKVLRGKAYQGRLELYEDEKFYPKFLQKMRVFNERQELLLWRQSENTFSARLRIDDVGKDEYCVEANQLLLASKPEQKGDWIVLKDNRGTQLYIPFDGKSLKSEQARMAIKTRNYIDYNEIGQAGYVDCRFLAFEVTEV